MGIPKAARDRVRKNKYASVSSHNVESSAGDFLTEKGSYEAGRNAARSLGTGRLLFVDFRAKLVTDTRDDYAKAGRAGTIRSGEGSVIVRRITAAKAEKIIAERKKAVDTDRETN